MLPPTFYRNTKTICSGPIVDVLFVCVCIGILADVFLQSKDICAHPVLPASTLAIPQPVCDVDVHFRV